MNGVYVHVGLNLTIPSQSYSSVDIHDTNLGEAQQQGYNKLINIKINAIKCRNKHNAIYKTQCWCGD